MTAFRTLLTSLVLLAGLVAGHPARAAESYDNCAGTITSLPAWISTQGVWCLKGDLSTNITSGAAITISANNVTIDCNDFKIGGLAGGAGSIANGIETNNANNATIRHCNIRGFREGMFIQGSGHLVEDNRLDNNLVEGIDVQGDNNVVQRNRVLDTGGANYANGLYIGINVYGDTDVLDNLVAGVVPTTGISGGANVVGIYADRGDGLVAGNRVRGLVPLGNGNATGVFAFNVNGQRTQMRGNDLIGKGAASSIGIHCYMNKASARDNTESGFAIGVDSGCTSTGNLSSP